MTRKRCSTFPPDVVIHARDELARAMKTGNSKAIEQAYRHLEAADRAARTRRESAHALRIARRESANAIRIVERVLPVNPSSKKDPNP